MAGMLAAFLGPYAALAVFLRALCGTITDGLLIVAGKMQRRHALPFGVFMAVGGVVVLFLGPEELWAVYLGKLEGV